MVSQRDRVARRAKVGSVRSEVQNSRLMLARKGGRVETECVTM